MSRQSRTQSPQAFWPADECPERVWNNGIKVILKCYTAYPVLCITQGNWQHFKTVTLCVEKLAIIAMYPLSKSENISNETHVFRT